MSNITEILKKVKAELSAGLPFMEGREKGSIVFDIPLTIEEFDFLTDNEKNEPYVCFLLREDKEHFYFGGGVVTEKLKAIKEILSDEELKTVKEAGLQVTFVKKKSKDKNREYTDMELI